MFSLLLNTRVLFGALIIAGAAAAIASGATGAFFSDTETSTNNQFTAGAIDLKVDNDSYYNTNRCTLVDDDQNEQTPMVYQWVGTAPYPVPGTSCTTSFPEVDLDDGFVFFDFLDLKPDDEGEDTISLHVQNDAWACMDLTLTSNDDNSTTEPEGEVDEPEDAQDAWDGELAQNLEFFWWADDGDNVLEDGEEILSEGVQTLLDLAPQGQSFSVVLADSQTNAWGETPGTPLPANETVYIAKAWCLGTLTPEPVADDGDTGPQVRGTGGYDCDGSALDNETQTDGVELDIIFRAEQARNNGSFLCDPREQETATLRFNKIITADTEGIGVEDFELHINGPLGPEDDQIVSDNIPVPGLPAGAYNLYEVILVANLPPGVTFTSTFGGACAANGDVTLNPGDNLVCTLNNTEIVSP